MTQPDTELTITRVFNAPRDLVWQAWTDPDHIMQWWGPKGFENASCASDLRVGGRFRLEMCAPDGNVYPCVGAYTEIVPGERIVYASEADDSHPCGAGLPPRATVTVTFAERDGKTTLTHHTRFETAARKGAAVKERYLTSWQEAFERLAESVGLHYEHKT